MSVFTLKADHLTNINRLGQKLPLWVISGPFLIQVDLRIRQMQPEAEVGAGIQVAGAHDTDDAGDEDDQREYRLQGNEPEVANNDTQRNACQETDDDGHLMYPCHGFLRR